MRREHDFVAELRASELRSRCCVPFHASADALDDGLLSESEGSLVATAHPELDRCGSEIEVLPQLAFEVTEVLRR